MATMQDYRAMPSICSDQQFGRVWDLKVNNHLGVVWVARDNGDVQIFRYRDGNLCNLDENHNPYTSLED